MPVIFIVFTLKIRLCSNKIIMNYLLSPFFHTFFFISIRLFVYFFCFPNIIMYILNIASAIKNIRVNEIRGFIFEGYYKQIGFLKENMLLL